MSLAVDFLNGRVIAVLVRYEEGSLDVASVGILALSVEHILVQVDVVVVDGVVEADHDHLRDLTGVQFAGDFRARFGAETVGQQANGWVAWWGTVRVRVQICRLAKEKIESCFAVLLTF